MNKRFFTFLASFFLAVFLFVSIAPSTKAISIFTPFGGKVILTPIPGVVCPTGQPFMIAGSTTIYVLMPSTKSYLYRTILPSVWTLGLAETLPLPICAITSLPPVPVLARPIIILGTSLPSL